jgi:hypothetical protein
MIQEAADPAFLFTLLGASGIGASGPRWTLVFVPSISQLSAPTNRCCPQQRPRHDAEQQSLLLHAKVNASIKCKRTTDRGLA